MAPSDFKALHYKLARKTRRAAAGGGGRRRAAEKSPLHSPFFIATAHGVWMECLRPQLLQLTVCGWSASVPNYSLVRAETMARCLASTWVMMPSLSEVRDCSKALSLRKKV